MATRWLRALKEGQRTNLQADESRHRRQNDLKPINCPQCENFSTEESIMIAKQEQVARVAAVQNVLAIADAKARLLRAGD